MLWGFSRGSCTPTDTNFPPGIPPLIRLFRPNPFREVLHENKGQKGRRRESGKAKKATWRVFPATRFLWGYEMRFFCSCELILACHCHPPATPADARRRPSAGATHPSDIHRSISHRNRPLWPSDLSTWWLNWSGFSKFGKRNFVERVDVDVVAALKNSISSGIAGI